ncbi:MAG: hypothetical protein FD161_2707 [Limisphaerales bacterium]|nr:MAG: hypothetical protein FD161_2707 [Limisphaerales bacterium]KAG0508351.1 MAG: hypothetical protein E1N63_2458 [Limisphaerales bacterium]TXT52008.1 MAG: hypothetical protein FD140_1130 [Limisphaerales bacterium]
MNYAVTMHFGGTALRSALRPALLGAALAWGAQALPAGEPIRFSGRTGPAVAAQDFDRREPLVPAEARTSGAGFARSGLPMDALLMQPQAVTPTTGLTRRQLEAQDQRRNWIFQSPEAILKQGSERDDENKLTRDDRNDREKPKSAVERFLEGKDDQGEPADKMKPGDATQRTMRDRKDNAGNSARNSRDTRDQRDDNAKVGENSTSLDTRAMGSQRGGEERGLFSAADARGGSIGRAMSEARERERQRERDASLDAFKRSFNNPWAQPAASGMDPARPFGGGGAVNAGIPSGFERRAPAGALGQGNRPTVDLGPRGGLGDFDPKNPLNYGGPETVLKQETAPRAAPKPVVLEIPKRKF